MAKGEVCKGTTNAGNPCPNRTNARNDYCCKAHAKKAGAEWNPKKKGDHTKRKGLPSVRLSKRTSSQEFTFENCIHFEKSSKRISSEGYTKKQWYVGVYLHSAHWDMVKRRYFNKFDKRCSVCGTCGGKYNPIQLHHTSGGYEQLWQERWQDLVALCKVCHGKEHGVGV